MARAALVLGGAAFIGSHLLSHLASSGRYKKLVSGDIRSPRFVAFHDVYAGSPRQSDQVQLLSRRALHYGTDLRGLLASYRI
jgi:uncharacterized protein YbjT (DUF2867 family)